MIIIQKNHPLQDKSLEILSWLHRDGVLHLTLVLPDGSRSLIPAAWTNLNKICPQKFKISNSQPTSDLIASTFSLLHARKIVDALLVKLYSSKKDFKNTLKEDHSCAKTNRTLARSGRTTTKSRDLEGSQSSTSDKNYNSSISTYQQVHLPGEDKSNQGKKS